MGAFDFMFSIFPIIWILMFLMFFGMFAVSIGKSISQWNKNNHSPKLTVEAKVLAKRHDVSRHRHSGAGNHHHHTHISNTYFVTFEVASGDRMELQMEGHEYGLLIEGDSGKLTFQGTRYLGFERT